MSSFINEEMFANQMRASLNDEMLKAAEPLIQQALKAIETVLRKRIAEMLVSTIDTSYSLHRDGRDIIIRVGLGA